MKKFVLLGLAVSAAVAASAVTPQTAKAFSKVQSQISKASLIETMSKAVANEKFSGEFTNVASRPAKVKMKADGDIDTTYFRPEGSWFWDADETGHGFHGLLVPAFAEPTWRNQTTGTTEADQFKWWVNGFDGKYYLAAETADFAESTGASPFKNYYRLADGKVYGNKFSTDAPFLTVNDAEEGYQYDGLVQYGGVPQIVADTMTADLEVYPVSQWDPFTNDEGIVNPGYFYFATDDNPNGGAYDPNAAWTTYLQRTYPTATNAKVEAICQWLEAPAAAYILKNITWTMLCYTTTDLELTMKARRVNEEGLLDEYIAEATAVIPAGTKGRENVVFTFETEDELGGLLEGITIKDAVMLELTGFQDAIAKNNTQLFCTPAVAAKGDYSDKVDFNAYCKVSFDMDGSTYESYRGAAFGYYTDETYTEVEYTHCFFFGAEVEMPWLVAETNEVALAADGGEQAVKVASYKSGDEWDVWTVDGEELPEWLSFSTDDALCCQNHAYNYTTDVTFSAEALPAGVDYRECEVKISYRDVCEQVIKVTQGEKQEGLKGDVNGDGEVDVKDSAILINVVLGLDDAAKYAGRCDVDGNGEVDAADINALINIILGTAK